MFVKWVVKTYIKCKDKRYIIQVAYSFYSNPVCPDSWVSYLFRIICENVIKIILIMGRIEEKKHTPSNGVCFQYQKAALSVLSAENSVSNLATESSKEMLTCIRFYAVTSQQFRAVPNQQPTVFLPFQGHELRCCDPFLRESGQWSLMCCE